MKGLTTSRQGSSQQAQINALQNWEWQTGEL